MARRIFKIAAVIIAVIVLLFSTYGSTSVCVQCGCRSSATELQLPLLKGSTYFRYRTIEQTPLCDVARNLGFIEPHSHDWKLMYGSGNGIACALGRGVELDPTVRSLEVARFIDCTHQYHGRDEALAWFQTALDYQHSKAIRDWLRMTGFSENGFLSAGEYEEWRRRADPNWPEVLNVNRERWPDHARPVRRMNPTR